MISRFSANSTFSSIVQSKTRIKFFVRDGILSVADYNSTRVGVVVIVVTSQFGLQFHSRRPAQPANQPKIKKWANSANFYPIEFKLGKEVINNLPDGNSMFEAAATIFRPTSLTNQNRPKVKIFNFRVFHPI